jgi:hypothetical protein
MHCRHSTRLLICCTCFQAHLPCTAPSCNFDNLLFAVDVLQWSFAHDCILIAGDNEGRIVTVVFVDIFESAVGWQRLATTDMNEVMVGRRRVDGVGKIVQEDGKDLHVSG